MKPLLPILIVALAISIPTQTQAQSEFWCWNSDQILADVQADSVLIQHVSALYNCCPEPITYVVEVGDATIFVEEQTQFLCDCDCCMDLEVVLENVPPGPWNLLFRWFDLEVGEWVSETLMIEVPDVGQTFVPEISRQTVSACLVPIGVPEPRQPEFTWGKIKARYR